MPALPSDATETRTATVPDSAAGRRFDAVVADLFPEFSRSRLTLWIKSGDLHQVLCRLTATCCSMAGRCAGAIRSAAARWWS